MIEPFRLRYDRVADVLYVSTAGLGPAHGEEGEAPGLIWRFLDDDNTLVGVTVMDFSSYWRPRFSQLVQEFSTHFGMPKARIERVLETADL